MHFVQIRSVFALNQFLELCHIIDEIKIGLSGLRGISPKNWRVLEIHWILMVILSPKNPKSIRTHWGFCSKMCKNQLILDLSQLFVDIFSNFKILKLSTHPQLQFCILWLLTLHAPLRSYRDSGFQRLEFRTSGICGIPLSWELKSIPKWTIPIGDLKKVYDLGQLKNEGAQNLGKSELLALKSF